VGLDFKSCARGYPICRVLTVPPPGPTSGEAVNLQVKPIPSPRATLMIFVLDGFEAVVQFHQQACGGI
jgi:hypothetical protein